MQPTRSQRVHFPILCQPVLVFVWLDYMGAELGPLFDGTNPRAEKDLPMDFVVYFTEFRNPKPSTVATYLSAIRWVHLANGFPDPLLGKPRLVLARRAMKRLAGAVKGKLPVTPDMLHLIRASLDLTNAREAVVWGGLTTAFFFLLRSAEYCDDPSKALQIGDVQFFNQGQPTTDGQIADEVVICIRSSKTDQGRTGAMRNAYATDNDLCPVKAIARVMDLRRDQGALGG